MPPKYILICDDCGAEFPDDDEALEECPECEGELHEHATAEYEELFEDDDE